MTTTFDPAQYKRTTRAQWEDAAEAWHRWSPTLEAWLGGATDLMINLTVRPGDEVLDVAAGAGGQSLAAARAVGPTGRVVASDISPAILGYAAKAAASAGLTKFETLELDGERLHVAPGTFDVVLSRLGLIYFPDQVGAVAAAVRALRPGGRVAAIVYSTADRNEFFSVPVSIIRTAAQLPPPLPGQPGPFSLGGPGVLEGLFTGAGLLEVAVHTVPAPLRMASAAECVRFERESFGALHQMLAGVAEPDRAAVWADIEAALGRFDGRDGFVGPCELVVAVGHR